MQPKAYIFNASFYTTPPYRPQWENWLYKIFFPFVSDLAPDVKTEVFEVLSEINQDMYIFSVQLRCSSYEELKTIQKMTAPVFDEFKQRFGETVTNFNSVLNKID
ncbi:MAG: DUF4286 domain-containing protein [Marinilabilia sp.]